MLAQQSKGSQLTIAQDQEGKKRGGSLPAPFQGRHYARNNTTGVITPFTVPNCPPEGTYSDQLLVSAGHPGPPYKSGGPFVVKHLKDLVKFSTWSGITAAGGTNNFHYDGIKIYCLTSPSAFSSTPVDITTTTFGVGATGLARTRPGTPEMGLGQAVVEARQVPKLPFRALLANRKHKNLKDALKDTNPGDEYLNLVFGWKPLLKDIQDMIHMQSKLAKILKQLARDNGRMVRRSCTVANISDSTTTTFDAVCLPSTYMAGVSKGTEIITSEDVYSFSGRFRYFIPKNLLDDPPESMLNILKGLDLSPELAWNLMPWSWLLDWTSNFGDLMSNISASAAENVVMDYGYAMGRRIRRQETFVPWTIKAGLPIGSGVVGIVRENSVKMRVQAYPFAFGPTPGSLTLSQAAILGALGISNRPGR